ncbi:hypothetical protein D3C87_1745900 [compost metagenome]
MGHFVDKHWHFVGFQLVVDDAYQRNHVVGLPVAMIEQEESTDSFFQLIFQNRHLALN